MLQKNPHLVAGHKGRGWGVLKARTTKEIFKKFLIPIQKKNFKVKKNDGY